MLRKRFINFGPEAKSLGSNRLDGTATFSRRFLVLFFFFLFSLSCFADDQFVPGQVLVKFKTDVVSVEGVSALKSFSADKAIVSSASIRELNKKHRISKLRTFAKKGPKFKTLSNGKTVELFDMSQLYLLEFPKDIDVNMVVRDYQNDPSVEFAEPNYIKTILSPNDQYYVSDPDHDPNQWGLYKISLNPSEEANSGWGIETGTSEVKIAVIDTGVNYNHVDLVNRVDSLEGYDFVNGDSDPMDDHGHGTHCSGIIGAETNNIIGIAGVNWDCRIIPIKILDNEGYGNTARSIDGINWAASKGAKVISMSYGGGPKSDDEQGAISNAAAANCVLVAAAGNNNSSAKSYPAAYDHVISVAATDPYDHKASYSNYGSWVKISAPGGDNGSGLQYYLHYILSSCPTDEMWNPNISNMEHLDGSFGSIPNHSYAYLAGTSMATPFVAGLAALVRAKFPTLTADEVAQKIISSADNIDAYNPSYVGKLGSGRINAFAALAGLYGNISFPISKTVAIGEITVLGSATGEGFVSYEVDSGLGANPISWTKISSSETPVQNGTLATFDSTGLDGYVTIRLTLNDLSTKVSKVTFQVGSSESSTVVGSPQYGPNPFNPNKQNIMIMYSMTANADVYIYFFDITGRQLCRKWYPSGSPGGSSGTNRVYWDGKSDYGGTVANGVYLFRIFSGDRTIGKGKIVVLK